MIEQQGIEQHEYEFVQAFWSRRSIAAYSIFAFNIIIFALMWFAGGTEALVAFGAKTNFHIDQGEIWRFVTPIFLHVNIIHLGVNSYALWIVGPQVEKLYGSARFLLLYVLTGIGGVAASYLYSPSQIPSAGASGALFGMFGILLVFSFKYRKSIPRFFSQAMGKGILLTIAINIGISFLPGIDKAAHFGGLISGCFFAAVVPFLRPGQVEWRALKVLQYALVGLISVCFFQVALHYDGPSFSWENLRGRETSTSIDFANSLLQGQTAFEASEAVLESGDFKQLPRVREDLGDAIDLLNKAPSFSGRANELHRDLLDVLQKQYAYVQEVQGSGRPRTDFLGASPQTTRYARLKLRIMNWFEEQGFSYRNVR